MRRLFSVTATYEKFIAQVGEFVAHPGDLSLILASLSLILNIYRSSSSHSQVNLLTQYAFPSEKKYAAS